MGALVILGDSHTVGYMYSVSQLGLQDQIIGGPVANGRELGVPFASFGNNGIEFSDPRINARINAVLKMPINSAESVLKGSLMLSMGLDAGTFLKDISLQWHGLYNITPKKSGQYLSEALLDEMMEAAVQPSIEFYRFCHQQGWLIAALAGPPMQRRHSAYTLYGDSALRLWDRFQKPVRALMAELGVPVISPIGTVGLDGLMLPEFWGKDATHGNIDYGKKMICALLEVNNCRLP